MSKFQIIVMDPPYNFSDSLSMSNVKRGANANYKTMSNKELLSLDISSIVDPDGCILALWVPSSLLPLGLELMKKYNFNIKQTYIWVKTKKEPFKYEYKDLKKRTTSMIEFLFTKEFTKRALKINIKDIAMATAGKLAFLDLNKVLAFGMGRLFRQTHEICLIGTSNNKIYKKLKNKSQRSVSFAPNLKHSAKPEDLQDALEIMFPDAIKLEMFARRKRKDWTCIGNEVCNGEDIRDSINKLL